MERRPGILRRYGLALLLVGVMGYILVTTTLPAAAERDRMRALRSAQERQHQALQEETVEWQAWLHGMQHDPILQRRMDEQRKLTPEIRGPVLVPAEESPSLKTSRPSSGR